VVGPGAYGGSALVRGLAALSVLPVMPDTAPLQVVHLDDLLDAIVYFLRPDAPSRLTVEVVGPRRYTFEELVALFRKWMRWPAARLVRTPTWLAGLLYRLGDFAGLLGWQPPVRSTAQREMVRGAVGDPAHLTELTGIKPRELETVLARTPASVQERWFARLYLLKPLVFIVFPLFWIATGIISLGPGRERGINLVMEGGLSRATATFLTISGALSDIVIGLAIAYRPTTRAGLYAALLISIVYTIIGAILVPRLWVDPLGPMLKIAPVMVFNLVALAILEDR
jgi:DoxX-like family